MSGTFSEGPIRTVGKTNQLVIPAFTSTSLLFTIEKSPNKYLKPFIIPKYEILKLFGGVFGGFFEDS